MAWINVGNMIVNVDNIDYVERISPTVIVIAIRDKKLEITETMAVTLWNYLISERLPFYDTETPTRDFSGT
jgi:hypothetical protein